MVDQFYTPKVIADTAVSYISKRKKKVIADFTIGDGSLIKSISFRYDYVVGMDLNTAAISSLKRKHSDWNLKSGNFLYPNKDQKKWLDQWQKKIDVVLLNPPFSCRGSQTKTVTLNGKAFECRTAMAFIINSLKYLKNSGTFLGIVPLSVVKSEMDQHVIEQLKKNWIIEYRDCFDDKSFVGCSSKSVIVIIKRRAKKDISQTNTLSKVNLRYSGKLLRGTTQMFKTSEKGDFKVLHTSNLHEKNLVKTFKYCSHLKHALVEGELLFIPRVGNPDKSKITIIDLRDYYLLSDCLFAIKADIEHLEKMKEIILKNWDEFKSLYNSTCAPYITTKQLCDFFLKNKVALLPVKNLYEDLQITKKDLRSVSLRA